MGQEDTTSPPLPRVPTLTMLVNALNPHYHHGHHTGNGHGHYANGHPTVANGHANPLGHDQISIESGGSDAHAPRRAFQLATITDESFERADADEDDEPTEHTTINVHKTSKTESDEADDDGIHVNFVK